MSSLPSVAIISVNYNQTALTAEMLESLQSAGLHKWCEAWVVDNASTVDGSAELTAKYPWVKTIRSKKNLGFAGGNNLAVRKTEADYIFLLNNDALIDAGVLEGLLDRFRQNPTLGAISPVIYDYPQHEAKPTIQYAGATAVSSLTGRNETLYRGEKAGSQPAGLQPIPFAHGAAMLVSRKALLKAGLMEEAYFLYYEELDWCDRIRKAGFDIALDGDRAIWHRESVSTGGDSAFKTYWINRSRILYMRRNKSSAQSFIFQCFYLFSVLPLHGIKHFLAGRKQHAKALWRAYIEQPSISTKTEHLPARNASPPKPILTAAKA